MRLNEITDDVLEEAVRAQPAEEFDTHDVIFWISRHRPREYVEGLHAALQDAGDPFISLHTTIGRRLATLPHLLQKQNRKVVSMHVRGEQGPSELWRRVSSS